MSSRYWRQPEYELKAEVKNASARATPSSRISRSVSSRNGRQLRLPRKIGRSIPCACELGLERGDQLAVLAVDRADAAEELVVVRHLLEPLARDVAPARDVLEERDDVVRPFGPAERDDEQRVEERVR